MRHSYSRGTSLVFGVLLGVPIMLVLPSILRAMGIFAWIIGILCGLAVLIAAPILIGELSRKRARKKRQRAIAEKAIGVRRDPHVAESASLTAGGKMTHDIRLALIDSDGDERFAAIIDGTFQIGKSREELPTRIEDFARAILIDGKDGRFVCADGRKPGILKFSGRAKEARAYRLDPAIAAKLGVPPQATR